ncbi:alpha/beta-type small acid-soluble spore protein [Clostridium sp. DJ247]|uniref:alpha/beta-type small acid-soluble spore protein n=1 Tax=Clostridium sp. DJ247 TaxID=2726188 RepID=UPI001A9B223F|nr:alpha/beta-type small acid-soluble spore protein [Clostridium sp. DJ247]
MSSKQGPIIPQSQDNLSKLKEEVSTELGVEVPHASGNKLWGYVPASRCGTVGGNMVKKMIESFEKNLIK